MNCDSDGAVGIRRRISILTMGVATLTGMTPRQKHMAAKTGLENHDQSGEDVEVDTENDEVNALAAFQERLRGTSVTSNSRRAMCTWSSMRIRRKHLRSRSPRTKIKIMMPGTT